MLRAARVLLVSFAVLALLAGCSQRGRGRIPSGDRDSGAYDGTTPPLDLGSDPRDFGSTPPGCATEAGWIYLVDRDYNLMRYEPDSDALTTIGALSCPAGAATPFSMAVDRNATAWVLYNDGNVYRVNVTDASCTASGFTPNQLGFEVFGMGFATESSGSTTETLYISGGPLSAVGAGSSTFGTLDTTTLTVASRGTLAGTPELTGNGAGELWGFFPDTTPMSVRQLDKTNGATMRIIDVAPIDSSGLGGAQAWAFAFWGGRYYIFYTGLLDTSTGIYRVTPDTGAVETVRTNIGYTIVGAGVSTCAPVILL
jgi:hypothetical protein